MRLTDALTGLDYERSDAGGKGPLLGHMHLELRGPDGKLKAVRDADNLIVDVGRDGIMEQLVAAPAVAKPTHMAVGTGATAPAAGNTALGAEVDRNSLTTKTRSLGVLTMVGDWAAGDATNAALAEAGVFNAASGPAMYSRATFTAIDKQAADTLQITWTYTGTPS
jgi:hypothetical protein